MLQKNKSPEDVLDIKDKLTTRGNVVKNHTLRGKNRGSTLWDRAGILYQGTELYESWTTLLLHTISRTRAFGALNGV